MLSIFWFILKHETVLDKKHKFSICSLKFKALSIVIPSNSTSSDAFVVIDPIFRLYFKQFFFPSIINWNFPGFVFSELILNQ